MEAALSPPATLAGVVRGAATIVVVLALPVFLVTNGVRWVTLSENFYLEEFAKHRVGAAAGLTDEELRTVARAFIAYFQGPPQSMDTAVALPHPGGPLFNQRELDHMRDVQLLMHRVFQAWTISLVVLLVGAIAVAAVEFRTAGPALARTGAFGGGLTLALVGLVALASLFDFRQLFLQFHFLAFTNDLWLLDPTRDRLIQVFPQGFFFDAAIRIALQAVLLAALLTGVSAWALLRR